MHKQRSVVIGARSHHLGHTLTGRPGSECTCVHVVLQQVLGDQEKVHAQQNVAKSSKWIWFVVQENCAVVEDCAESIQGAAAPVLEWPGHRSGFGPMEKVLPDSTGANISEARRSSRSCKEEEIKVAAQMCRPEWDLCPQMSFGIFAFQWYKKQVI